MVYEASIAFTFSTVHENFQGTLLNVNGMVLFVGEFLSASRAGMSMFECITETLTAEQVPTFC